MNTDRITYRKTRRKASVLSMLLSVRVTQGCAVIEIPDANKAEQQDSFYRVSITRAAHYNLNQSDTFVRITPEEILPQVLTGFAFLPAVTGTRGHTGVWGEPGAFRIVELADGTTVKEQLIEFMAPERFSYRVWDFDNRIIKSLADGGAMGKWVFQPAEQGTRVEWTYTFYTSKRFAVVPLSIIVGVLWRGYMDVCLDNFTHLMNYQS